MKKTIAGAVIAIACLTTVTLALAGERAYLPVKQTPDMKTGYIERIEASGAGYAAVIDEIEWYEGEAAAKVFREREGDTGMDAPPDGYYVVNDDTALSEFPIAADAEVVMQIYTDTGNVLDAETNWDETIPLEKFIKLLEEDNGMHLKDFPYHVEIKDGRIVRIVQQFIP